VQSTLRGHLGLPLLNSEAAAGMAEANGHRAYRGGGRASPGNARDGATAAASTSQRGRSALRRCNLMAQGTEDQVSRAPGRADCNKAAPALACLA
jgi:hypothetical protein